MFRCRNSIARWIPWSSRPSTGRSRACVAPPASTMASKSLRSRCAGMCLPISVCVTKRTPSSAMSRTRRSTTALSSFMFGMPYMSRPPARSARSNTVTVWPARLSCCAAARPAGPDPTIATRLPVRTGGGCGVTQPSANARSTIPLSMSLIVTGGSLMPSVQLPSHGAGHTRPVNSGKLFVFASRMYASCHWPR